MRRFVSNSKKMPIKTVLNHYSEPTKNHPTKVEGPLCPFRNSYYRTFIKKKINIKVIYLNIELIKKKK